MDFEYPSKLSPKERENILKAYEAAKPKFVHTPGLVLVCGTTSGDVPPNNFFRDLWNMKE